VTLYSADMPWAGLSPYHYTADPRSALYAPLELRGLYPAGGPIPFPAPQDVSQAKPFVQEFTNQAWRPGKGFHRRGNINECLPPSPAPDASGRITDHGGFEAAQGARQLLAHRIFARLLRLTGAVDHANLPPNPENDPRVRDQFRAQRWLAQLAV